MKVFSNLMREIKEGKFVFTGELEPEKETNLESTVKAAQELKGYVTACNVTDNPNSMAYVSSLVASYIIQERAGMEAIYQLRCTDRNAAALTSDILGACVLGIRNILALTGDHIALGDYAKAKPVYDLDSAQLTYMIRRMVDERVDLYGNEIHGEVKLHVGVAANPNCEPLEAEILKLGRKVEAGAEFVQTQVIYDIERVGEFFELMREHGIRVPVLIGIFPLKSYGVAKFFDEHVAGVHVPAELMEKITKAKDEPDKQKRKEKILEINLDFFIPFLKELKKTEAAGCHIMAVGYPEIIPPLTEAVR